MANYYQIYCSLETKLEFGDFSKIFSHIPSIDDIVSFLNSQSTYNIIENEATHNNNFNGN